MGLCEEGKVLGIPPGNYTRSKKNKGYALAAVRILKKDPGKRNNLSELWKEVTSEEIEPNSQMAVVVALWEKGFLLR